MSYVKSYYENMANNVAQENMFESDDINKFLHKTIHIATLNSPHGGGKIMGITMVDDTMYMVSKDRIIFQCDLKNTKHRQPYDVDNLSHLKWQSISFNSLVWPRGLASSAKYRVLYITDWKKMFGGSLWRFCLKDKSFTEINLDVQPFGVSAKEINDSETRVIVTCSTPVTGSQQRIVEFVDNGRTIQPLRTVNLPGHFEIPRHALSVGPDEYVICHGWTKLRNHAVTKIRWTENRVSVVAVHGKKGDSNEQSVWCPLSLNVTETGLFLVADYYNNRIKLLSAELKFISHLVTSFARPRHSLLDAESGRLFVALENGETHIFQAQLVEGVAICGKCSDFGRCRLPCDHTFCLKCLMKHSKRAKRSWNLECLSETCNNRFAIISSPDSSLAGPRFIEDEFVSNVTRINVVTKPENGSKVMGLTLLNGMIYMVSVEGCIYECALNDPSHASKSSPSLVWKTIAFPGLRWPRGLASTSRYLSLYITDWQTIFGGMLWKFCLRDRCCTKSPLDVQPFGVSVSENCHPEKVHVFVTCATPLFNSQQRVVEFEDNGTTLQQIRTVSLPDNFEIPRHTVLLESGDFVICHGWTRFSTHGVSRLKPKSGVSHVTHFHGNAGKGPGEIVSCPLSLHTTDKNLVLMVDYYGNRLQLLTPELLIIRHLVDGRDKNIQYPRHACLDSKTGSLYVGLEDGDVHVFQAMKVAGMVTCIQCGDYGSCHLPCAHIYCENCIECLCEQKGRTWSLPCQSQDCNVTFSVTWSAGSDRPTTSKFMERHYIHDRYASSISHVDTIIKPADSRKVMGMTILNKTLYMVSRGSKIYKCCLSCYNEQWDYRSSVPMWHNEPITVEDLERPEGLASSEIHGSLYVSDSHGNSGRLWKIRPADNHQSYAHISSRPYGVSVTQMTRNGVRVFVTCSLSNSSVVMEFMDEGLELQIIRVLNLPPNLEKPRHSVMLQSGQFIVCDGYNWYKNHRVILTEIRNNELETIGVYGNKAGNSEQNLRRPLSLHTTDDNMILVVDSGNHRIHLLTPELQFIRHLVTNRDASIQYPSHTCLDGDNGFLYVGLQNGDVHVHHVLEDNRFHVADESKENSCSSFYSPLGMCESHSLVTSWADLKIADHVAWKRFFGAYYHHAIVVDKLPDAGKIIVFEYTPNDSGEATSLTGEVGKVVIKKSEVEVDFSKKVLYRYNYDNIQCYPDSEVLSRAGRLSGQRAYNLFGNNCEHFATWCKTGVAMSYQVRNFVGAFMSKISVAFPQTIPKICHIVFATILQEVSKPLIKRIVAELSKMSIRLTNESLVSGLKKIVKELMTTTFDCGMTVQEAVTKLNVEEIVTKLISENPCVKSAGSACSETAVKRGVRAGVVSASKRQNTVLSVLSSPYFMMAFTAVLELLIFAYKAVRSYKKYRRLVKGLKEEYKREGRKKDDEFANRQKTFKTEWKKEIIVLFSESVASLIGVACVVGIGTLIGILVVAFFPVFAASTLATVLSVLGYVGCGIAADFGCRYFGKRAGNRIADKLIK